MEMSDTIVVGAGVGGLATAYHLVKKNKKTLLLEQFGLPHSRGSSHGQSRIIRYAYPQEHYVRMMEDAYPLWAQLERETGTTLFKPCGMLVLQRPPYDMLDGYIRTLARTKKPLRKLTPGEAGRMYPGVRAPGDYRVILDESAGTLRSEKALICFQNQFTKLGGTLHDEEGVTEIIPGETVTVCTKKATYRAKSIVITPGPWAAKVLEPLGLHLPLKAQRIRVFYWKVNAGDFEKVPCIIDDTFDLYLLPEQEYPGLIKIVYHGGAVIDPDSRDSLRCDGSEMRTIQQFIREVLPGVDHTTPVIEETCIYTRTPDDEFIIDRHPSHSNIIIGCGFSGHGFKLAPATGKVLAELATGQKPSYNIKPLSIARFGKSVLSKASL